MMCSFRTCLKIYFTFQTLAVVAMRIVVTEPEEPDDDSWSIEEASMSLEEVGGGYS